MISQSCDSGGPTIVIGAQIIGRTTRFRARTEGAGLDIPECQHGVLAGSTSVGTPKALASDKKNSVNMSLVP